MGRGDVKNADCVRKSQAIYRDYAGKLSYKLQSIGVNFTQGTYTPNNPANPPAAPPTPPSTPSTDPWYKASWVAPTAIVVTVVGALLGLWKAGVFTKKKPV